MLLAVGGLVDANASGPDNPVATSTVCFAVHNGAVSTRVIGTRFASARTDTDRVIVLVYGHSGTRQIWDWRPGLSVARTLARAGYLVITYDRLTAGDSTYRPTAAGNTVSYDTDREMLAEIIQQIEGTYPYPTAAPKGPCRDPGARAGAHPKVILFGHSLGGALAGSYPGAYQELAPVAAVVQANYSNAGFSDTASARINAAATTPANIAAGYVSLFLDDGSTPAHKSLSAATCAQNRRLLLAGGGLDTPAGRAAVCAPTSFDPVPYGDYVSAAASNQEDQALISRTPATLPVLLAFGDHDCFVPAAPSPADPEPCGSTLTGGGCDRLSCQQDEINIWRRTCPCKNNVTVVEERDAGHSFMWSPAVPGFLRQVVTWLHRNHR
jgi:pimeloyl-ACP methyl ester carboxylesterase